MAELTEDQKLYRQHRQGNHRSPTYHSWRMMIERCTRENKMHSHNYIGRGITVHPDWMPIVNGKRRRGFLNFLADMGERPEGMTLDRKDNDGNYEPSNCRWATLSEQARNQRRRTKKKT